MRVAGRVCCSARQGKLTFATLRDGTGDAPAVRVSKGELGDDAFDALLDDLDLGDWVGVEGTVMKTKQGRAVGQGRRRSTLLAKALRPLPEKWHGLADVDTRYRQRYVDLIANDDARRVFDDPLRGDRRDARASSSSAASSRSRRRCCTVHPAARRARPFVTHHNALDMPTSTCASRPSCT